MFSFTVEFNLLNCIKEFYISIYERFSSFLAYKELIIFGQIFKGTSVQIASVFSVQLPPLWYPVCLIPFLLHPWIPTSISSAMQDDCFLFGLHCLSLERESQTESQGEYVSHLMCFPSFKDHSPAQSVNQCHQYLAPVMCPPR